MAENGSGRLDRIETLLESLAQRQAAFQIIQERDHEEFKRDHEQLLKWQVLTQERYDRLAEVQAKERERLDQLWESTDKRIADLVRAIGGLTQSGKNLT